MPSHYQKYYEWSLLDKYLDTISVKIQYKSRQTNFYMTRGKTAKISRHFSMLNLISDRFFSLFSILIVEFSSQWENSLIPINFSVRGKWREKKSIHQSVFPLWILSKMQKQTIVPTLLHVRKKVEWNTTIKYLLIILINFLMQNYIDWWENWEHLF